MFHVKSQIIRVLFRRSCVLMGLLLSVSLIVSCSSSPELPSVSPMPISNPTYEKEDLSLQTLPGKDGWSYDPVTGSHMKDCTNDQGICAKGTTCLQIANKALCMLDCKPVGDKSVSQSSCIKPEVCMLLGNGRGFCIHNEMNLGYGRTRTTKPNKMPQLEKGEMCLPRWGGCKAGLICVDSVEHFHTGKCRESCIFPANPKQKAARCLTPNTTCMELISGKAACL